jgi:ribonuclease-3 family protein
MHDYFSIQMPADEIRAISSLGLAHLGDAVYEVMVRSWMCVHGKATAKNLHRETVSYVRAPAQAKAAEKILPLLDEEETGVYKRGRNAHVGMVPKNATRGEYMQATGLEALFGYLYLNNRKERLNQLFSVIMNDGEETSHAL